MEGGSKNLVQSFVCEKLAKRDFRWDCSSGSHSEVVSNGTSRREQAEAHIEGHALDAKHEEILHVLRETSEEFELRYQRAFSDLTSQLHITPATAYQSFEQVVGELFRDGTNWGRIVAFFSFGGALCVESADKEMNDLLPMIIQWMAFYLDTRLEPWIREHGGWEAFVSLYGNDAAANSRKSQERFGRWLLTGVTLAGIILLASYFMRR